MDEVYITYYFRLAVPFAFDAIKEITEAVTNPQKLICAKISENFLISLSHLSNADI
jgi:hypothetical protein